MHNIKEEVKKIFRALFTNDTSVNIKFDYSNIDSVLNSFVQLLGKSAYDSCLLVVNNYIDQVEQSLKTQSKARFCLVWYFILHYCKQNQIKENSVLGVMLGVFILEYSKKYHILLKDVDSFIQFFNKEDGPFLLPEKWTLDQCDKTFIAYYLRELYVTAMETTKNPFAINSDHNFNFDVLERKNTIFMNLLLDQN